MGSSPGLEWGRVMNSKGINDHDQDQCLLIREKINKNSLVILHCPPLILKTGKKFLLYKSIPHLIQNSSSFFFFFFENFDLLKIFFKLLLSTCLHFNTGLKLV